MLAFGLRTHEQVWDERILQRIPLVRSIYASVKQVTESMFSSGKSFRKVVLVEYPRKGMWSLAFRTSTGEEIRDKTDGIPYFFTHPIHPGAVVPQDVVGLDTSVDDGLKMLLSVGVVVRSLKGKSLIHACAGFPERAFPDCR
jgi:uncharacterized membrane protein